jgi:hypothetical protein
VAGYDFALTMDVQQDLSSRSQGEIVKSDKAICIDLFTK